MEINATNTVTGDEAALEAVRSGDVDRYRELVERHERLVYAVAWSRLGDASLAEEVTQETFIRAYQRLPLLDSGKKFSQWIATIARNLAINVGLRRRRELTKRERWALEVEPATTSADDAPDEICTPEMLRETMASLPSGHRECLVLFYLENKSNAEAAGILGISEATFRVRLHRARTALREQLEAKLSASLEQLRPRKPVAPAVMASVLASPALKAGATGGLLKFVPMGLLKFLPIKFLIGLPAVFTIVPSVLLQWFVTRAEQKNFRDQTGFRAKLHRENSRRRLWMVPLFMVAMFAVIMPLMHVFGYPTYFLGIAIFAAFNSLFALRNITLIRTRQTLWTAVYLPIVTGVFTCVGLGVLSPAWIQIAVLMSMLGGVFSVTRPLRMDYNLFLRAAQGMLRPSTTTPVLVPQDRRKLIGFARFLGERLLVISHRWTTRGLQLELAPVRLGYAWNFARRFWPRSDRSMITLRFDGGIEAHLHEKDQINLIHVTEHRVDAANLSEQVVNSLLLARAAFSEGNFEAAESALGQVPDKELFVVPGANAPSLRRYLRFAFTLLVLVTLSFFAKRYAELKRSQSTKAHSTLNDKSVAKTNPILTKP